MPILSALGRVAAVKKTLSLLLNATIFVSATAEGLESKEQFPLRIQI